MGAWGGEDALAQLVARDGLKAKICADLGITLIPVDYPESLTDEHIRLVFPNHSINVSSGVNAGAA